MNQTGKARLPADHHSVKTFACIEGLRGYMAWWVVIGHAIQLCGIRDIFPKPIASLLMHGSAAVNVFIVVSGFVITNLVLSRAEPYSTYIARRTLRIFPIYIFCLVFSLLTVAAYEFSFTSGSWVEQREMRLDRLAATQHEFASHLLLHLTMLHGLLPDTVLAFSSSAILAPAWSLSLEWQFYLVAPFLIQMVRSSRAMALLVIGVSLGLLVIFQSRFLGVWQYPSVLPASMHFFLIGILSRIYFQDIVKWPRWILFLIAVIGGLLIRPLAAELLIWAFFLTVAVLEHRNAPRLTIVERAIRIITSNSIVTLLGRSSYSTYLVHIPVFAIATWAGSAVTGVHSQQATIVCTVIATLLLVPVSFALYQFIERPFMTWGKVLLRRAPAVAS